MSTHSGEDFRIASVQAYWCERCGDIRDWFRIGGKYHCECGARRCAIPLRYRDDQDERVIAKLSRQALRQKNH